MGDMFGFNIGGSKNKSKSSSTSTESFDTLVTRLSAGDTEATRALLKRFSDQQLEGDEFTSEKAIADVQGAVQGLFTKYKEQTVPEILGAQSQAGAYGSTTAQRLANDAFARTAAAGAELEMNAIKSYADIASLIRQTGQQGIGLTLETLLKAQERETGTGKTTTASTGKSSNLAAGFQAKFG